ncbi:ATPase involved in DNA repair [Desulfosporosinus sp. I2]|uniref:AAA family ATPase n=1 Tax=Desulfosporosinus sp. I2 TaxID=1617025 RepID=UPI00061E3F38|nr:AAA family ATPase [Desulfosporosinus sp. I2]KJR44364.1 ATPase involved in DNA repair [Desulfosporosinus sp. I2]
MEFSNGVNIIYGPSNTGKTYIVRCIDYLFGSDENPIDETTGYDCIKLIVKTAKGSITLSRKLSKKKVEVLSSDNKIESGTYLLKGKYEKTINSIWLRLIGVDEQYFIIKNEQFEKQCLTLRTFIHIFLLTEQRIINNKSILLPITATANTATISSLLFLANGNDFGEITPQEDKKIKKAKKNAVVAYINKELSNLADRKGALAETLALNKPLNLDQEISNIIDKISSKETAVTVAISRNQQLLKELTNTNERLSECNILYNRYQELKSQYSSAELKHDFLH